MRWKISPFTFVAALAVVFPVTLATAGPPDAGQSTAPSIVYDPGSLLPYRVTVRDAGGTPLIGSSVSIVFTSPADAVIFWCSGQPHPTIPTQPTDGTGVATFTIAAGGCVDSAFVGAAADVYADGILLGSVGAVSPDVVDTAGVYPWDGWNAPSLGMTEVGLKDAIEHAAHIKTRIYSFCTDIDSDGRISLVDAVLLTSSIKQSSTCN